MSKLDWTPLHTVLAASTSSSSSSEVYSFCLQLICMQILSISWLYSKLKPSSLWFKHTEWHSCSCRYVKYGGPMAASKDTDSSLGCRRYLRRTQLQLCYLQCLRVCAQKCHKTIRFECANVWMCSFRISDVLSVARNRKTKSFLYSKTIWILNTPTARMLSIHNFPFGNEYPFLGIVRLRLCQSFGFQYIQRWQSVYHEIETRTLPHCRRVLYFLLPAQPPPPRSFPSIPFCLF